MVQEQINNGRRLVAEGDMSCILFSSNRLYLYTSIRN